MTNAMGKLPPQACELEEAVLGALLLERDSLYKVIDTLKPESFYQDAHGKIYSAILDLFKNNSPVDILTVRAALQKRGHLELIGGIYYITKLTDRVVSAANIDAHAKIIQQKYLAREIIRVSGETLSSGYDDTVDIFELIEKTQSSVYNLLSTQRGKQVRSTSQTVPDRIAQYRIKQQGELTGLGSGFKAIDDITGGWQKTDLIILAARPAMGKSALALQIAKNAAIMHDAPVVIFSLEMSENQLTDRLISSETGIYQEKLLKRQLNDYDFQQLEAGTQKLLKAKIFIDDTSGLYISSLRSKAIRLKQLHNIQLIVIDYLQLMDSAKEKGDNREQVISKISRSLKALAKDLEIPVIALSQLSREVEKRPGHSKRPMLSDLREKRFH